MGLFKIFTSIVKGAEAGFKETGRGSNWRLTDLQHTPYLYDSRHINNLADEAIKSGDPAQMQLIKEYLQRFNVQNIPSYKSIIRRINVKISPPKSELQLIHDLQKEIEHLKHVIGNKTTSMIDWIENFHDYI